MKQRDVIRLEQLFQKYPSPHPQLRSEKGRELEPGQIWKLAEATEVSLFDEIFVLGPVSDDAGLATVDAAPLVRDALRAGPMDYILPEEVLCHPAVVLLSLSFSLPTSRLGEAIGVVSSEIQKEILAHYDKAEAGALSPDECHAPDFFDSSDSRHTFHAEAAEQITRLQREIYAWLAGMEEEEVFELNGGHQPEEELYRMPAINAVAFFEAVAPSSAIAAAGGERPEQLETFERVVPIGEERVLVTFRKSVKPGHIALVIRGKAAALCAKVLNSRGEWVADIEKGEARFELSNDLGEQLIIVDADGRQLFCIRL